MTRSIALAAILFAAPLAAGAGDTLVVAGGGGAYSPDLAKSWSVEGDAVAFLLADGVDGNLVAGLLKDRLAKALVSFADGKLIVKGIPLPALLDQLSVLPVSSDPDPLVALAGLGGGVPAGEGQEAGGSIRASSPTALALAPDKAELVQADVLEVTRGAFPQVVLELRVRRSVGAGVLKGKAGRTVEAPVLFAGSPASIDFANERTQHNLAAYYLKQGDRVVLHVIDDGGRLAIDWLERR